jgi:predicted glycosyltransferase
MRILTCVWHPKDVNTIKNTIECLEERGHIIKIVAASKENTLSLLDAYGFNYEALKHHNTLFGKAIGLIKNDYDLYKIAKKFKPDVLVGGSPYAAHVGKLIRKPHISFPDTERATLALLLTIPFTNKLYTPTCFYKNIGSKQVRFNSYSELAYLHPTYFSPDPSVLKGFDLNREDRFILLRFSSLDSSHDVGVKGFDFKSDDEKLEFIEKLEVYGRVFLTSEVNMSSKLNKCAAQIPLTKLHDFIAFATLYVGEGASMAAEAAVLGVPSIYVSTTRRGYLDELEARYGLAFTIPDRNRALEKAIELLEDVNTKNEWGKKREIMLKEKIDTTEFMVGVIEKWGTRGEKCVE